MAPPILVPVRDHTKLQKVGTNTHDEIDTGITKLAGIEALADVTDATNVTAAGAVMAETQPINLPAEAAYLPITNPAALIEEAGATVYAGHSHLAFDDTTSEHAVWRIHVPGYDGGNITVTASSKIATSPKSALTGTFATTDASTAIVGTGTLFTTELAVNSWIKLNTDGESFWRQVASITDNLNLVLAVAYSGTNATAAGSKRISATLIYNILTIGIANGEEFNSAVTVDTTINISHSIGTTIADVTTVDNITTATIDPANVSADDLLVIELARDVATDTLVGDGELLGIILEYTRA